MMPRTNKQTTNATMDALEVPIETSNTTHDDSAVPPSFAIVGKSPVYHALVYRTTRNEAATYIQARHRGKRDRNLFCVRQEADATYSSPDQYAEDDGASDTSARGSAMGDGLASDKPRGSHCAHSFGKSTRDLISSVGARVQVFGWDAAPVVGYCGAVQKADPDGAVLVYYDDGHRQWHDPNDVSRFQFILQEPAGQDIYQLRWRNFKTYVIPRFFTKELRYQAKALDNRVYWMDSSYVKKHYSQYQTWLSSLDAHWQPVPKGAKLKADRKLADCVLGSLAKSLDHNNIDSTAVKADIPDSLVAKCAFKFAASRANAYGLIVEKINSRILDVDSEFPVLLHADVGHAITVCKGLIFDSAQPRPFELTRENVERCTGNAVVEQVVRGYLFKPKPKKLMKRKTAIDAPESKRVHV